MEELPQLSNELSFELRSHHTAYTRGTSTPGMAISLPTAMGISRLCHLVEPASVLDFGSGFSTVCFALLKRFQQKMKVTTVDTSAEWLAKTIGFLRTQDLKVDTWFQIDEAYDNILHRSFDLILHDIGDMRRRGFLLPVLWELVTVHGWIVLDDIHVPDYQRLVHAFLDTVPHRQLPSAPNITRDQSNRYAAFVQKLPP